MSSSSEPDVVFALGPRVGRVELQYALRSLSNLAHGRVWLIGGNPGWVVNTTHVRFHDGSDKWKNIANKWRMLPSLEALSERFVYTEDDYFILEPVEELSAFVHPMGLDARVKHYRRSRSGVGGWLLEARNALAAGGYHDCPSFEVHVPMLVEKSRIPLHLYAGRSMSWRSPVGATSGREPVLMARDVKVTKAEALPGAVATGFLSSSESTFKRCGAQALLHGLFPDPCRYEKEYYMDASEMLPESSEYGAIYSDQEDSRPPNRTISVREVVARRHRLNKPNLVKLASGQWVPESGVFINES